MGGLPVVATDADEGDTLTHTLGGPDMDMFRLRDNGQIEVSDKADLNYEDSASHTVTITATDSSGAANNSATIDRDHPGHGLGRGAGDIGGGGRRPGARKQRP